MYDIATELLETDEIYLFNDQIVIKLPNEDFKFEKHTDNQYGPYNDLAEEGVFKTITSAWILDDFTIDNGPVSILNKQTNEWDIPLPKKGDMVIWDGNTLHESSINQSNKERAVWLCVYSTHDLTLIKQYLNAGTTKETIEKFKYTSEPVTTVNPAGNNNKDNTNNNGETDEQYSFYFANAFPVQGNNVGLATDNFEKLFKNIN